MQYHAYAVGSPGFETVSACKLPDKPRGLMSRYRAARATLPQNIGHLSQLARTMDHSVGRQFRSDEVIHGFAKSRTDCSNPLQNWRPEDFFLHPLHWPTQRPDDLGRYTADQRILRFSQVAPVLHPSLGLGHPV